MDSVDSEPIRALKRAVEVLGGQQALARELAARTGKPIRQGHIWSWMNRTGAVPPEMAPYIEVLTTERGDPVRRQELCPDFPWDLAVRPARESSLSH